MQHRHYSVCFLLHLVSFLIWISLSKRYEYFPSHTPHIPLPPVLLTKSHQTARGQSLGLLRMWQHLATSKAPHLTASPPTEMPLRVSHINNWKNHQLKKKKKIIHLNVLTIFFNEKDTLPFSIQLFCHIKPHLYWHRFPNGSWLQMFHKF